jgi:hypothetical protein
MNELCKHYMSTGFPRFKPWCRKDREPTMTCHSQNECPDYVPCEGGYYRDARKREGK